MPIETPGEGHTELVHADATGRPGSDMVSRWEEGERDKLVLEEQRAKLASRLRLAGQASGTRVAGGQQGAQQQASSQGVQQSGQEIMAVREHETAPLSGQEYGTQAAVEVTGPGNTQFPPLKGVGEFIPGSVVSAPAASAHNVLPQTAAAAGVTCDGNPCNGMNCPESWKETVTASCACECFPA